MSEVYGHSGSTLFKVDPQSKAVTTVGNFEGCVGVVDIALDKDSNMFAST